MLLHTKANLELGVIRSGDARAVLVLGTRSRTENNVVVLTDQDGVTIWRASLLGRSEKFPQLPRALVRG